MPSPASPAEFVDARPQAEREAVRVLRRIAFGVIGCALLGAGVAVVVTVYLTTPKENP